MMTCMVDPTTPTQITPTLQELAREVNAKEPVFVEVRPEDWADKGNCFQNAKRFCEENADAVALYGFLLRSNGVWAEAEYHAIVRLPSGELIDPTQEGTDRVLFAEIEGELPQNTPMRAIAISKYSSVVYYVSIHNQAHAVLAGLASFDANGARSYASSPELERLMHADEEALREVKKAFKKKDPEF